MITSTRAFLLIYSSVVGVTTHEIQNLLKRFPESFYNEKKYLGEKPIFPEAQKSEFYKQIPVPYNTKRLPDRSLYSCLIAFILFSDSPT